MLKKTSVSVVAAILILCSCSVFAQTNQPSTNQPVRTMYSDWIQIKNDAGNLMASISPDGKVAIAPNYTFDDVVNTLIARIISQNQQFQEQMKQATRILDAAKNKADMTSQKALEIIQLWNPAPVPQPAAPPQIIVPTNNIMNKIQVKKPEVKKEESPITIQKKAWYNIF